MGTPRKTAAKAITIADPFRATGADLKTAAAAGNEVAIAELARRAAKKAATSAATPVTA